MSLFNMTKQPKIIKRQDKPVHPDIKRVAKSMRDLLQRRYPDPLEREVIARRIMQDVKAT